MQALYPIISFSISIYFYLFKIQFSEIVLIFNDGYVDKSHVTMPFF